MGLLTLSDFQDELVGMIGSVGPGAKRGSKRLTRYINMGYSELTSTMEFKELFAIQTIPTVADTKTYTHATNMQSVRGVIDTTNKVNLRRVSIENFFRLDPGTTGQPSRWAREGGLLYLWAVPDAVYSIDIPHQVEPTALATPISKTVLNNVWDQAVLLFAAAAAATINADQERAELFLARARGYVGSRISDPAADANAPSMGITVAMTEEQLLDQEA